MFCCSFLLIEKNEKIKAAKEMLKFYFVPLRKNNSSMTPRTDFSAYRFTHKISGRISFEAGEKDSSISKKILNDLNYFIVDFFAGKLSLTA
jgi:hypothetical protein